MSDLCKLCMIGLPGTGKTTYLAALWHHLEAGEVADQLDLPELQPDRSYLNAIRDSWLSLSPVPRTTLRSSTTVTLSLRDRTSGRTVELAIPDASGETFQMQWATRKASSSYGEFAKDCEGAFLFLHPQEVRRTHILRAGFDKLASAELDGEAQLEHSSTWTPAQTSTQVQVVDLLQMLRYLRESSTPLRVAVVISAWDLVRAPLTPVSWLEKRMPLLFQYLYSNADKMHSQVFGVSAQGGDLSEDRERLLSVTLPGKRCQVLEGESKKPGLISAPLRFVLCGSVGYGDLSSVRTQ